MAASPATPLQRIEAAWPKLTDDQRDTLAKLAEGFPNLPAIRAEHAKLRAAEDKRKAAKAQREAAEVAPLIQAGNDLSEKLWHWMIGQSPTMKEVAYQQDSLSLWLDVAAGRLNVRYTRRTNIKTLKGEIANARKLVKQLPGPA